MIRFSNGRQYTYFIASGMLGFDGEGATIVHQVINKVLKRIGMYDPSLIAETSKTITFYPINGPKKVRPRKNGWWNNYGLDNPGLINFLADYSDKIREKKNFIISLAGKNKYQLRIMMDAILSKFPNILAFDLNTYCPNHKPVCVEANEAIKIIEFLKRNFDKVDFLVKVRKGGNHYKMIAKETEGMVKAFRINGVSVEGGGAISGKIAQPTNWPIMEELISASKTDVIGPSIWRYEDINWVLSKGAKGVDFGSRMMPHYEKPWGPGIPFWWARKHKKEQDEKDWYLKAYARSK